MSDYKPPTTGGKTVNSCEICGGGTLNPECSDGFVLCDDCRRKKDSHKE